jgi:endonuclease IV
LHLNDIHDACGSKIDQHMTPGEGKLGLVALERFMNHPKLRHAQVILELPAVTPEQEEAILATVRSWKTVKNKK